MHPVTFHHKVARRLRRAGEAAAPRLFFRAGPGPGGADERLARWARAVPFAAEPRPGARLTAAQRTAVTAAADAACARTFALLGSGPHRFAGGVDWHADFKSGHRWPADAPHVRCAPRAGADIKVPWELSRFHHAVSMGLADQCGGGGRYAAGLAGQVDDWIRGNPVGFGVNWACAMDVAIRAANWLAGAALLADAWQGAEFRDFRARLNASLWQHARFLRAHLEWNGPKETAGANHFLSDLAGLLTLGRFFDDTTAGAAWFGFAHRELERQSAIQVLPDGVHFERSPSYHRLCLELFLWCGALAARAGRPFSPDYADRVRKMQQFVADYVKPSGVAPLIGDNDDGRLFNPGLLPFGDHRYLRPAADRDGAFHPDRFLLDGCAAVDAAEGRAAAYPDGGFHILRNARAQVIVRAGALGPAGAHAHNDQLSFELNLDGRDLFVDPGTYLYTSDPGARNRYRSTAAHNAMQIDDAEQNPFGASVFGLPDCTRARVLHWDAGAFDGEHRGFPGLGRPALRVRRRIALDGAGLRVTDTADGLQPGDRLGWRFVLAPGLEAETAAASVRIRVGGGPSCDFAPPAGATAALEPFAHSPSYGVLRDALSIVVRGVVEDPAAAFTATLRWESK